MSTKASTFWIILALLVVIAAASSFFGYWPVAIGLAIVIIALLISRALQARGPRPSE